MVIEPLAGSGRKKYIIEDTFYLRLNGVRHRVKDHSYSERGNPLPPLHGLLYQISSKGCFIYTFICIRPTGP